MHFVFLSISLDGELEDCKLFGTLEMANGEMADWMDYKNIDINDKKIEDCLMSEDMYGNMYYSFISHKECGKCYIVNLDEE